MWFIWGIISWYNFIQNVQPSFCLNMFNELRKSCCDEPKTKKDWDVGVISTGEIPTELSGQN